MSHETVLCDLLAGNGCTTLVIGTISITNGNWTATDTKPLLMRPAHNAGLEICITSSVALVYTAVSLLVNGVYLLLPVALIAAVSIWRTTPTWCK